MPHPFSTALLVSSAILAFLGAPVGAVVFMGIALLLELGRFMLTGVEAPQKTEVLVRSGEEPPEQGRTTLLRG